MRDKVDRWRGLLSVLEQREGERYLRRKLTVVLEKKDVDNGRKEGWLSKAT